MYQTRIYTLRTTEALERYATVYWSRHIASMPQFGVTVRGLWTAHDRDAHRLVALLSFREGVDPAEFTAAFVASPEFAADMQGFDLNDIIGAEELLLDPVAGSPLA
ncbi:NIPSNAP family protein [Solwaraspora sp. WMMD1047]|uniref:NIPSNAP family protein n=1 Tax=Solwaraspora sp. WMMD1047 TaxID=3016102 RepID=UPI002416E6DA|nr:NIPSNAP family protein [Solwaraspora sp. WMMD1047]MDG4828280.1 NIPSNAP family protein [Solwaraspora sp. WMMD1047]